MNNYDCLVIGGGITGSSLAYELIKQGFKVILLEKNAILDNATSYSYGGLAYWSGTTELTRILCQEGIETHRQLSVELETNTEFREIDLLLTIDADNDPETVADSYKQFHITPTLLTVKEAYNLEPLLNPSAISGALKLPHGHIHPEKLNQAYQKAFIRSGGHIAIAIALDFIKKGDKIQGVITKNETYYADKTIICAGGLSRQLLKQIGIKLPIYFTHAQVIKTSPVDIKLSTLVMPATQKRIILENQATQPEKATLWEQTNTQIISGICETGAVQFMDNSLCLGQISDFFSNPNQQISARESEATIRQALARLLPSLSNLSGTWHSCLVAFSPNSLPLVGVIPSIRGIYLFSGFTSTLLFAPPLAKHFAQWLNHKNDAIIPQLSLSISQQNNEY